MSFKCGGVTITSGNEAVLFVFVDLPSPVDNSCSSTGVSDLGVLTEHEDRKKALKYPNCRIIVDTYLIFIAKIVSVSSGKSLIII